MPCFTQVKGLFPSHTVVQVGGSGADREPSSVEGSTRARSCRTSLAQGRALGFIVSGIEGTSWDASGGSGWTS